MNRDLETDLRATIQDWLKAFPSSAPLVVIPVFNAYDDAAECVESILASTQNNVPVLVLDDASTDERIAQTFEPLSRTRSCAYIRKPSNSGFVKTVNLAFEWCAPHDVVVVNSDVVVPPDWLSRFQAAAYFRSTIATATPFTNDGTIVSVPYRNKPMPTLVDGMTTAEVDDRIRGTSLKLRPVLPTAVGHCVYFKRSALDSVGYFDETFSPGYGEEVDFSQRAVAAGLIHVLADDLFVYHKGSRSFGSRGKGIKRAIQESHERMINQRYPWYRQWVVNASTDPESSLAFAIERARAALLGYRIAIDATCVDGMTTGTQVQTLELIRALATAPHRFGHLTMIIEDKAPREALHGVDRLVDQVVRVSELRRADQPLFDLIHRPFQIRSAGELGLLQKVATRFIVSQLDCIAFSNPSYAADPEEWEHYRCLTQLAFSIADGIVFNSDDVARDAAHQGLHVPGERTCVAYNGVDHHLYSAVATQPPDGAGLEDESFILVLGTNFKHKNRVFALRAFQVLVQMYRWNGRLVFAGPSVAVGGSESEEALELDRHPELSAGVLYLGTVSEAEKEWLLKNAALVLCPSHHEGFGLVPFEAARAGRPALTSRSTSLAEILGDQVIYLDTLNPEAGARIIWSFLSDPEVARKQVEAIKVRATAFTWSSVADRLLTFYARLLEMPPRPRVGRRDLEADNTRRFQSLRRRVVVALRIWRTAGLSTLLQKVWRRYIWLRSDVK